MRGVWHRAGWSDGGERSAEVARFAADRSFGAAPEAAGCRPLPAESRTGVNEPAPTVP